MVKHDVPTCTLCASHTVFSHPVWLMMRFIVYTFLNHVTLEGCVYLVMTHPLTCSYKMAEAKPLKYSYCGKEYQFISKDKSLVEKFLCPICQELLFEPVQTSCGHLFCGRCLKNSDSKNCPSCRTQFSEEPHKDKFNEREVKNLIVKCPSSSRGCVWEGELGNVSSHVNEVCGCQLVQCPNKCGEVMERRDIEKHKKDNCELREYTCPYCLSLWPYRDTFKNVTTVHLKECAGFPLDCPNNCGKKRIRREDMPPHLAVCPEQVVPCRYQSLGCKARLPRKQMEQHMKDKDTHLEIALATTTEIVDELNRVKTESREAVEELKKQVDALLKKTDTKVDLSPPKTPPKPWLKEDPFPLYPPCTVKVELDEKVHVWSSYFTTHPGGYRLRILYWRRKIVNHSLHILHVNGPNDNSLRWPVDITVNCFVLSQKEDRNHYKCTYSELITHPSALPDKLHRMKLPHEDYTQDGNMYIKIESADVVYK